MPQRVFKIGFFSKILFSVFVSFFISISQSFSRSSEKLYSIGSFVAWNSPNTWSLASNGVPSGLIPQNNDTIIVEGSVVLNTDFCFSGNGCLIISDMGFLQGSNFDLNFTGSSSLKCNGNLKIYNLTFSNNSTLTIEDNGNMLAINLSINNSTNNHLVLGKLSVTGSLSLGQSVTVLAKGSVDAANYSGSGSISGVNLSNQIYNGSTLTENNWLGTISSNWDEPLNWSLGLVPHGNSNVSVLVSSNNPEVDGNATCNNLFVNPSSVLGVKQDAVFEILGDLSVIGNGKLLLKNSLVAKASLILNGNVSGNIQSEYQIVAGEKNLLSSPVGTALSSTFLNMYLRSYNETSSQWGEYIVPTDDPLQVMQGYELYSLSSATRIFEGIPNHDPKSFSISNEGNGLNLTGNPYPCYIDWENNDNNAWQRNAVAAAIYYPDPSGSGNFSVYLPGGDDAVSLNNGNRYIAPMQGFFVKAGKQGALTVNTNSRVRSLKDSRQGIKNNSIKFKLNDSNGLTDEAAFRVIAGSTLGFDDDMDAIKLPGNANSPSIHFTSDDELKYAINTIPTINSASNIPLNIECANAGMFSISASGSFNFEQDYPILLEDKELNTFIDLRADSVYSFYHSPEMDSKRFEIHFNSTQGTSENQQMETKIQVLQGEIIITGKGKDVCTAELFSIDGKLINSSKGILSEGISLNTSKQFMGICILQLRNGVHSTTYKVLIK